ncbi:MAG: AsmA family protein, partial [Gammaproteobacteria bacterium]
MIQRFKYLLYALLAVLGLFVGLLVILPFIIDPNDYKPEITSLVEEHTGRSLQIEGDLELTVFPWLGIRTGRLELGNAEGFEGDIFVAVNSTQVRVKLFPLLSRNIEIGRVIIRGFEANLRRNNDGISNWQDLVETAGADDDVEQPDPNVETESGSAGFNTLQLGGLQIENGRFSFIDEQAGTRYDISNFTVETGRLAPNEPVEFSLALQLAASQPQVKGSFEIQTTLLANAKDQVYALQSGSFKFSGTLQDFLKEELTAGLTWQAMTFNNTEQQLDVNEANFSGLGVTATTSFVASNLDGEPSLVGSVHVPPFSLQELANRFSEMLPEGTNLPPGSQMEFESDFNVNLNTQALRINALRLGLADLKLLASINGEQIIDAPRFSGSLQTENFSPTRLLVNLGQTAIPTTDPNALSSASLATKFTATQSSVALSEMNLALDQTLLKGQFAIADFDKQAIRFDLIVDAIDADRYLPPVEAAAETPPEEGEPLDAIQLPVDPIQTLDIEGRFRIGKLHAFSMNTSNIDFSVSAGKGVVRIHPVKADLYDGQYNGDILYRIDRKVPLVSINESISEIQISGLSMDLFDENRI